MEENKNEIIVIDGEKKPSLTQRLKKAAIETKDAICDTAKSVKDWCVENKEAAIILIPIMAKCAVSIARQLRYSGQKKNEEDFRDLYIYDRSLGNYWRLRRKMTTREQLEFERRRRDGESIGEILEDMRLL